MLINAMEKMLTEININKCHKMFLKAVTNHTMLPTNYISSESILQEI